MAGENLQASIVKWLQEKGHSQDEIDNILQRMKQYEDRIQHDSVMDSIGADNFDISDIIQQVLRDTES